MSKKVYEIIQKKFVSAIQDVIDGKETLMPWQKPWKGTMPVNYVSRRPYSGINLLLLEGGEWLTFNQIKELSKEDDSIKLKKGSKGSMIVFWKMLEKKEEGDEEPKTFPMLRYYYVYNICDVEGLESKLTIADKETENEIVENVESVIEDYKEREGLKVRFIGGSNKACYYPSDDLISMPTLEQFKSSNSYYATYLHEIAHSTGHKSRLNRFNPSKKVAAFGSEDYSKEELVAEISSQMALGRLGIEDANIHENSLTYVNGWLKQIKEDANLIISASSQAQKACDCIFGE